MPSPGELLYVHSLRDSLVPFLDSKEVFKLLD